MSIRCDEKDCTKWAFSGGKCRAHTVAISGASASPATPKPSLVLSSQKPVVVPGHSSVPTASIEAAVISAASTTPADHAVAVEESGLATAIWPGPAHPPIEISLVPYMPEWARDFQREKQRLVDAWFQQQGDQKDKQQFVVVHVGSTCIVGAMANPYIDMLTSGWSHFWWGMPSDFLTSQGYRPYELKLATYYESGASDESYTQAYWFKPSKGESSTCKGYFIHFKHMGQTQGLMYPPVEKFSKLLVSDASVLRQFNEAKHRIVADCPRISLAEYNMLKTACMIAMEENMPNKTKEDDYYSVDEYSNWSPTPPRLYELIHFIMCNSLGHAHVLSVPFDPDEVFAIWEMSFTEQYVQIFTPLGLALVLAIEPRLSALWDRYYLGAHMNGRVVRSFSGNFGRKILDTRPSTSETERMQRLTRFAPVIRCLRQHGCTVAIFESFQNRLRTGYRDYTPEWMLHAANASFKPSFTSQDHVPDICTSTLKRVLSTIPSAAYFLKKMDTNLRNAVCLSELRNFGPSAAALCGIACCMRALDSLHLHQHLHAFVKENVTDDVVCALSTDDLRALGLGIGDAKRFSIAVQQEIAASQCKVGGVAAADSGGAGAVASGMSSLMLASAKNNSQPLLQTEYRGIIDILSHYTPSTSCHRTMIDHLSVVLPEVVRMPFIVQECTRKLESLQHHTAPAAEQLPPDSAFAILAYTYDLGVNSVADDGRCVFENVVFLQTLAFLYCLIIPYFLPPLTY
jgi:hypothetical protein